MFSMFTNKVKRTKWGNSRLDKRYRRKLKDIQYMYNWCHWTSGRKMHLNKDRENISWIDDLNI